LYSITKETRVGSNLAGAIFVYGGI